MFKRLLDWWKNRCPECATTLEDRIGPLGWGRYCLRCNAFPWQAEKVKRQGKDKCNKCELLLDSWGYCLQCNKFPHKKWLTEEEALFLDDEDFRRTRPLEYAEMERRQSKGHVRRQLTRTDGHVIPREMLVSIYGEDVVKEVEQELLDQSDNSVSS